MDLKKVQKGPKTGAKKGSKRSQKDPEQGLPKTKKTIFYTRASLALEGLID